MKKQEEHKIRYNHGHVIITVDLLEQEYPVISHAYITTWYKEEREIGATNQIREIIESLEDIYKDLMERETKCPKMTKS
jgi:FMN-dependent NADH-azoreductase